MNRELIKLSNRSILSIEGKDSEKFLQGIVTCNIDNINNKLAYGSILTPQGKLLYDQLRAAAPNHEELELFGAAQGL